MNAPYIRDWKLAHEDISPETLMPILFFKRSQVFEWKCIEEGMGEPLLLVFMKRTGSSAGNCTGLPRFFLGRPGEDRENR
jgi:hypothetical protein